MADLETNTSLGVALTEIEKKVVQAETDRDNLKTNLSNKGVDVSGLNKMGELVGSICNMKVLPNEVRIGDDWFIINGGEKISYSTSWATVASDTCKINGSYRIHTTFRAAKSTMTASVRHVHKRGDRVINTKDFYHGVESPSLVVKTDFENALIGDTFEILQKSSTTQYSCIVLSFGISCGMTYNDFL